MTQRDKRALLIFCGAVIVALALWLKPPAGSQPVTAAPSSVATLEKRLRRLQERASQKPLVAAEAEAATRALAETERGLLRGATPALASAEMQQLMKQMLQTHGINMQASEFGPVKTAGEDYSQVPLSVSFPCAIEQWINLMVALRNAPQVLATQNIRLSPGDQKNKLMNVHMVVAGYIRK